MVLAFLEKSLHWQLVVYHKKYENEASEQILNNIAQLEFGMDYEQLGINEREWCETEYENFF